MLLVLSGVGCTTPAVREDASSSSAPADPQPAYDSVLATRVGADQRGMRPYVLVILKTGPRRVPEGDARKVMFAGHFANIERLAKAGKLIVAGPFSDDTDGWRGLFLFAVDDIEEAKQLTATDPVIANGEMVAEYHRWYGSAAAMLIPEIHDRLSPKP
jgi:uncharacterized protein YciI